VRPHRTVVTARRSGQLQALSARHGSHEEHNHSDDQDHDSDPEQKLEGRDETTGEEQYDGHDSDNDEQRAHDGTFRLCEGIPRNREFIPVSGKTYVTLANFSPQRALIFPSGDVLESMRLSLSKLLES